MFKTKRNLQLLKVKPKNKEQRLFQLNIDFISYILQYMQLVPILAEFTQFVEMFMGYGHNWNQ